MMPEQVRAIQKRHGFIDRRTSRRILNAIVLNQEIDLSDIEDDDTAAKILGIRDEYWKHRRHMAVTAQRNAPFYAIIKDYYQGFTWREQNGTVLIDHMIDGVKPSLLSFLVHIVPSNFDVAHPSVAALDRLGTESARALMAMLSEAGFVQPSPEMLARLVDWLILGSKGEPLTIVSPVCPDYEVEPGGTARHRFTFSGLGRGIGVTSARLFDALPIISRFFRDQLNLPVTHYVCPGDFERFSAETNARLGIDEATFFQCLEVQLQSIVRNAPTPILSCLFTDLCGGKENWIRLHSKAAYYLESAANSGSLDATWLRDVALSRQGLYDRWYAVEGKPESFYIDLVTRQGAEYVAMGMAIVDSRMCPNALVLGADDFKMGRFYGIGADIPVLYLRRNYE